MCIYRLSKNNRDPFESKLGARTFARIWTQMRRLVLRDRIYNRSFAIYRIVNVDKFNFHKNLHVKWFILFEKKCLKSFRAVF